MTWLGMAQGFFDHSTQARQYRLVWFGLVLAIALDTVTQLCWKSAVDQVPATMGLFSSVTHLLTVPLFYFTLLLFLLQFFNWMVVLANADLSYAQPITALSYVTVNAASTILFHEHLSSLRFAGLTMILLGVWFISRTSHRTTATFSTHGAMPLQPEALP
jgi:drug/metabolite transporter (DMT)-like permease